MTSQSPTIRSIAGTSPLVLDSPHSGREYPADFEFTSPLAVLRRAEDTHVEALYDFAPGMGASWLEALFPRSYLDANRAPNEIDETMLSGPWPEPLPTDPALLAKVRLGKGLIWKLTDDNEPIYSRKLSVAEVQSRIERCWKPYYASLESMLNATYARHGYVLHINCHSMPAIAGALATGHPGEVHPDFVLGNRDHSTSSEALIKALETCLRDLGYSVALNHPYKGVELVRRFAAPLQHRHSIQVEINRKLYMDERTLERTANFDRLKANLQKMIAFLSALDPRSL
jgi:N-formylglutamate deformylase